MNNVWEKLSSATEALKRNTTDLTPVTNVCWKSYEVCWKGYEVSRSATVQAAGAVASKTVELKEYFADDQVRGNIGRVAKDLSFNGGLFLVRSYGGGAIVDVVTKSVQQRKADSQKEILRELEAKVAKLEREVSSKKILEHSKVEWTKNVASKEPPAGAGITSNTNQTPEDVLRVFMMKNFVGAKLCDDLIVPGAGVRRRQDKQLKVPVDKMNEF